MKKCIKIIITSILTAASITAIIFLSLLIASKFNTIADLQTINIAGFQDENIAIAMRDIWGLFIANITLLAWMVKSWLFICLKCFKSKRKTKKSA